MIEAQYYQKKDENIVCLLCPHHCLIAPGKLGICRARKNNGGKLWAVNYGRTVSVAVDPIEKKPLYHFYPGHPVLSIAPNGCNMKCPFCQNWQISQQPTPTEYLSPETLLNLVRDYNLIGVSYTYTEPFIWFEYLIDAGTMLKKAGFKNILVTNGLIEEEPLQQLLPLVDAMNIDLKTLNPTKYRRILGGDLDAVKRTIEIAQKGCHCEITYLIVTGFNDSEEEMKDLVDYLASIDPKTVLHLSRYFPHYKYKKEATPVETIDRAYAIAKEKLDFVYLGNIADKKGQDTICPSCGQTIIKRDSYQVKVLGLSDGKCQRCGEDIKIIG